MPVGVMKARRNLPDRLETRSLWHIWKKQNGLVPSRNFMLLFNSDSQAPFNVLVNCPSPNADQYVSW